MLPRLTYSRITGNDLISKEEKSEGKEKETFKYLWLTPLISKEYVTPFTLSTTLEYPVMLFNKITLHIVISIIMPQIGEN